MALGPKELGSWANESILSTENREWVGEGNRFRASYRERVYLVIGFVMSQKVGQRAAPGNGP
jgi:hypothetical protein